MYPADRNPLGTGGQLADTLVELVVGGVHVVVLNHKVEVVGVLTL